MKKVLLTSWIFLFLPLVNVQCWAGESGINSSPTPVFSKEPEKISAPPGENLFRFQSETAWGKLNVLIRGLHDSFKVEVKSEASAAGWILKTKTNQTVSKGGLNSEGQFQFQVNKPFNDTFRLTVILNSDREQVPVIIALSPNLENKPEKTPVETLEDYQENPDHPYHSMAKNLYDTAVQDYERGDNLSALSRLRKAEKLDPSQPQIQTLLQKLESTSIGPSGDLFTEAETAFKKGNKEEALAKIMDYLDQYPGNEKGEKLKDQIVGNDVSDASKTKKISNPRKKKKEQASLKTAVKKNQALSQDGEDIQSQADQVYNLGLDSYRKGDFSAAKKFWEQTIVIQPNHLQAQRNLQRLKEEHPDLP